MAAKSDVKAFVEGLSKPFADMRMRKTALFSKFLSVISAIEDVQKSGLKTLAAGITKIFKSSSSAKEAVAGVARDVTKGKSGGGSAVSKEAKKATSAKPKAEEKPEETPAAKAKKERALDKAKHLKVSSLTAGKTVVDKLVVDTLVTKDESRRIAKAEKDKSEAEKLLEAKELQTDLQDRTLKLQEASVDFEDRQAALADRRWDKSLPGLLTEHATEISEDFKENLGGVAGELLGPLHETAKKVGNLAIATVKHFKFDIKDKLKNKALAAKQWFTDSKEKIKQSKVLKAIEKHTLGSLVFQKGQAALQSMFQVFSSIIQTLMGGILSVLGTIAQALIAAELVNIVAGALGQFFDAKILPLLPDWMKKSFTAAPDLPKGETGGFLHALRHPIDEISTAMDVIDAKLGNVEQREKALKNLGYDDKYINATAAEKGERSAGAEGKITAKEKAEAKKVQMQMAAEGKAFSHELPMKISNRLFSDVLPEKFDELGAKVDNLNSNMMNAAKPSMPSVISAPASSVVNNAVSGGGDSGRGDYTLEMLSPAR